MEKISVKLAVLLLAFSVGITFASVFYFRDNAGIAPPPVIEEEPPEPAGDKGKTLEMVFVLDTTGSMGGLLDGAKQKIWSIVNDVMQKKSRPSVRVGLVAYRDRGDAYVTKLLPITEDLDKVYAELAALEAGGGGDSPEDVRKALSEGVRNAGWSKSRKGMAQIIFLVGDAPPQNYQNEPDVIATTAEATKKGMIVNTIQCGAEDDTRRVWQQIAQRGQGKYFAIAQDGGVETISTPYDEQLSDLGRRIGQTFAAYGAAPARALKMETAAATESSVANTASNTARADRAINKALNKDAYIGDLIQDIENGKTKLDTIAENELPDELQKLTAAQRKAKVEEKLAERRKLREEIVKLSKQREAFINAERKRSGKSSGFDAAVANALSEQLQRGGIN